MDSAEEMWLWLLLVMQPHNPKTGVVLLNSGYDIKRACVQVRDGVFPFLSAAENKRAAKVRLGNVRALQKQCADNGISIVTYDSADYPENLRRIDNAPIVLFVKGNKGLFRNRKAVAAVGTRTPSPYSKEITDSLCLMIARTGAVIVSGLAVGLDTAAHIASFYGNGVTAGVLACGHLVNYPAENEKLKEEILEHGGAIISELLPDTDVPRGYFDMRNRIISGLSDAVLVLEASAHSGALLTANHAFEQRRRVFFIPPHDITEARYFGAQILYREGATPVFGYKDVIRAITYGEDGPIEYGSAAAKKSAKAKPAKSSAPDKPAKPDKTASAEKSGRKVPEGLDEESQKVYNALVKETLDLEMIVVRTEIYYRTVLEILMELEIAGFVRRNPDATYSVV
ncbi:MAG: DNA-processing protein DprA [Oscillospiraceae bacterium]